MRVALSEIRRRFRLWVSVMLVQAAVAASMLLSFALVIGSAQSTDSEINDAYSSIGGMQISFVTVTGVVCIVVMVRVVVRMTRVTIAQWQLAGMSPGRASRTVFAMTLCTSVIGSSIGVNLGLPLWPRCAEFVVSAGLPATRAFAEPVGFGAMAWAWGSSMAVSAIAGLVNLRSVTKVEAVEAVGEHPMGSRQFGWPRVTFLLALVVGLFLGYWGLASAATATDIEQASGLLTAYWGLALLAIVALIAGGGPLVVLAIRAWTSLIPTSRSLSWFLARSGAVRRGEHASAIVLPLLVAGGVTGSLYGMTRQLTEASELFGDGEISMSLRVMLVLFGQPLFLALATTVAAVMATSAQATQDLGLLAVTGVSRPTLLCSVVLEYLIYGVTALLVSYGALTLNGCLTIAALSRGPLPGVRYAGIGPSPLLIIAGGFAAALLVAVIPVFTSRLNTPITASRGNRR